MQIDTKELAELVGGRQIVASPDITGTHIIALDRGWVFVGKPSISGDWMTIENARVIRLWGTTQGLGELRDGPTESTKLDHAGTVVAPLRAVIHLIKCTRDW